MQAFWLTAWADIVESLRAKWFLVYSLVALNELIYIAQAILLYKLGGLCELRSGRGESGYIYILKVQLVRSS